MPPRQRPSQWAGPRQRTGGSACGAGCCGSRPAPWQALVERVHLAQIVQRADNLLCTVMYLPQHEAQIVEAPTCFHGAVAVDAGDGGVQMLGGMVEVEDLDAVRQDRRQERPVVSGAIG